MEKTVYLLFVGKMFDEIGEERTIEILKECMEELSDTTTKRDIDYNDQINLSAQDWLDSKKEFKCSSCGRISISVANGHIDKMTQPNGKPCGGVFRPNR